MNLDSLTSYKLANAKMAYSRTHFPAFLSHSLFLKSLSGFDLLSNLCYCGFLSI